MGYDSYARLNCLEEVEFVAGTEYTFNFTVYEEDGTTPVDLNAATITWVMSYYGSDVAIVTKTLADGISVTGANTFRVTLDSASTLSLEGKFVHQPVIVDFNGSQFRPGQGNILILPANQ